MPRFPRLLLLSLFALGGCKPPQIVTYVAPKDPAPSREESSQASPSPTAPAEREPEAERPPRPTLSYQAPPNWVVGPHGDVTVVNFLLKGEGGEATVSVSPLGSFEGRESAIVNMWRQMAGAPPVSQEEALQQFTPFDIAGETAQLFEVNGSRDGKNSRIVTAMLHRPEGTWFFKLSGDDAVVSSQKPAFLSFLKTVKFGPPEAGTAAGAPAKEPAPAANPTPITNPAATAPPTTSAVPVATPSPTHTNPAATPTVPLRPPATPEPVLKAPPATPSATPPAPAPSPNAAPANPAP
jgi:hypothetical protein